jgi:hypothetical protein
MDKITNLKIFGNWDLVIGICLEFGTWDLKFLIPSAVPTGTACGQKSLRL